MSIDIHSFRGWVGPHSEIFYRPIFDFPGLDFSMMFAHFQKKGLLLRGRGREPFSVCVWGGGGGAT